MPKNIRVMVLIVTAYSGGSLKDVESATVVLRKNGTLLKDNIIGCNTSHTAKILMALQQKDDGW